MRTTTRLGQAPPPPRLVPRWLASACLLMLAHLHAAAGQAAPPTSPEPRIAAIALSIKSRAIQDSRCYLMNGGAVESFYISENTPVGSVIGVLSVNGDPSEAAGDISLSLQERGAAVGVARGSKNLTLLRPLDREERDGPSNVYVNVRCDRRRTSDPSFIIPVSVRVWDENDNAPVWGGVGGGAGQTVLSARVSELAGLGAHVVTAPRAVDADQPGPHSTVHYTVLPGPHSDLVGFENELESTVVVKRELDYESVPRFTVTLRAADAGRPPRHSDALLTVHVLDADDHNPAFQYQHYAALLPHNATEGMELATSPERISAADQDLGINAPLYYAATGEHRHLLHIHNDTGRVFVTKDLLTATLPATVVIKATQYDNPDRYALATLTISGTSRTPSTPGTQHAARDVQFSQRVYSASVSELARVGTLITTLHTNHDGQSGLQFYVSDRSFLDRFAITSGGGVLLRKTLDYEDTKQYNYQVMVTDGRTNDTAVLNISVVDENEWEPRFRHARYHFRVEAPVGGGGGGGGGLTPVGKLDAYDGDAAGLTILLHGEHSHLFYINDAGELFLRNEALSQLNSSSVELVATAVDKGTPPRQTSVPVSVSLPAAAAGSSSSGAALAGLGAALAALAALVCALAAYIYRHKRNKTTSSASPSKHLTAGKPLESSNNNAPAPAAPPAPAPAPPAPGTLQHAHSGSLQSVSAGASTILADSNSSLDLTQKHEYHAHGNGNGRQHMTRFPAKTRIAPLPPVSPLSVAREVRGAGAGGGGGGGPAPAWPPHTIPARVKKLSWDDAETHKGGGESMTAVHDATNPALSEHMNLTVYF